jgi:hypothetical protein
MSIFRLLLYGSGSLLEQKIFCVCHDVCLSVVYFQGADIFLNRSSERDMFVPHFVVTVSYVQNTVVMAVNMVYICKIYFVFASGFTFPLLCQLFFYIDTTAQFMTQKCSPLPSEICRRVATPRNLHVSRQLELYIFLKKISPIACSIFNQRNSW